MNAYLAASVLASWRIVDAQTSTRNRNACTHTSHCVDHRYVTLWITLSAAVILYNKWVLSYSGFKYAIALTMWHMLFCSLLAGALVRTGVVEPVTISNELYWKCVGACASLLCASSQHRQGHRANWRPVCRHTVARQRSLLVPGSVFCADAQGALSLPTPLLNYMGSDALLLCLCCVSFMSTRR